MGAIVMCVTNGIMVLYILRWPENHNFASLGQNLSQQLGFMIDLSV